MQYIYLSVTRTWHLKAHIIDSFKNYEYQEKALET